MNTITEQNWVEHIWRVENHRVLIVTTACRTNCEEICGCALTEAVAIETDVL